MAYQRVKELQEQVAALQQELSAEKQKSSTLEKFVGKLAQELDEAKKDKTKAEDKIEHLKQVVQNKQEMLDLYTKWKENDNETMNQLQANLEDSRAQIRELTEAGNSYRPVTPPATPAQTNNESSNTNKQPQGRKRARLEISGEGEKSIKIYELKFRSNNRTMFRAAINGSEEIKEYHADDICENFRDQVKDWLESKKEVRRGNQIKTIRDRGIDCLVKILDESNE